MNFLKQAEDEPQDEALEPSSSPDIQDDEPQSLSLMGGIGGGADEPGILGMDAAEKPKRLSQTTLVMIGVVAIAVAAIMAMKMTAGPMAADASTQQFVAEIDSAIQKLKNPDKLDANDPLRPNNLKELFTRPDEIINQFSVDYSDKNVPVEQVQKNPFRFSVKKERDPVDPNAAAKAQAAAYAAGKTGFAAARALSTRSPSRA